MALDEIALRALISETVKDAMGEAIEKLENQVTEVRNKVIGDGESGLSARQKRSEERLDRIESTFGKVYTIATIPLGGLIMLAVNYIFGQNHTPGK